MTGACSPTPSRSINDTDPIDPEGKAENWQVGGRRGRLVSSLPFSSLFPVPPLAFPAPVHAVPLRGEAPELRPVDLSPFAAPAPLPLPFGKQDPRRPLAEDASVERLSLRARVVLLDDHCEGRWLPQRLSPDASQQRRDGKHDDRDHDKYDGNEGLDHGPWIACQRLWRHRWIIPNAREREIGGTPLRPL
jgi:hypothetical protein